MRKFQFVLHFSKLNYWQDYIFKCNHHEAYLTPFQVEVLWFCYPERIHALRVLNKQTVRQRLSDSEILYSNSSFRDVWLAVSIEIRKEYTLCYG